MRQGAKGRDRERRGEGASHLVKLSLPDISNNCREEELFIVRYPIKGPSSSLLVSPYVSRL